MQAMNITKLVAYYRVSTQEQGDSGLGLEAQRAAVEAYAAKQGLEIVAEFTEIESGTDNNRAELAKAISKVKRTRGCSLIVKTQCRLARRTSKSLLVLESVPLVVSDNPNMTPFEFQLRAMMDEEEARRISTRTKDALKALKARGVKLGKPENLTYAAQVKGAAGNVKKAIERNKGVESQIFELRADGMGMKAIADWMNSYGFETPNGGTWHAAQVQRILKRKPQAIKM